MKRFLIVLAVTILLVAGLMACGGGTESAAANDTRSTTQDTAANGQEASQSQPQAEEAPASDDDIVFDGLTIIDNEECAVTIKEIDPDAFWGYTLKTEMENKSAEKTYMFAVRTAAVNGVESDPFFATEVTAGHKANGDISFSDNALNDIGSFTDIEMSFYVYDSDDWMADHVADQTIHIYPYGEEKAAAFVRQPQDTDTVLVDNDYATVIVTGYDEDGLWGYTVDLFLVNKTDTELMFSVEDASVNGYMADPFYASSVGSGHCAFSSMSWFDSDLENNGITDVEEIEFTLRVYDNEDWMAEDFVYQTVTLDP